MGLNFQSLNKLLFYFSWRKIRQNSARLDETESKQILLVESAPLRYEVLRPERESNNLPASRQGWGLLLFQ